MNKEVKVTREKVYAGALMAVGVGLGVVFLTQIADLSTPNAYRTWFLLIVALVSLIIGRNLHARSK